jgi:hypothetical protein
MFRLECLSTRTAVAFYRALGFQAVQRLELALGLGIGFPVTRMLADLRQG